MSRLVSIIIPVHNLAPWIDECLDSVLGQSHDELEIIAVDDGSTDSSLELLRGRAAADPRMLVFTQVNRGAAAARNLGIESARGEWLCFVDGDDFVHQEYASRLLAAGERLSADYVMCGAVHFKDEGKRHLASRDFSVIDAPVALDGSVFDRDSYPDREGFLRFNLAAWAKLFRRDFAAGLRFPEELRRYEDNPFCYQALATARRITYIRDNLYYYRKRSGSIMQSLEPQAAQVEAIGQLELAHRMSRRFFEGDTRLLAALDTQFKACGRSLREGACLAALGGRFRDFARLVALFLPHGLVKLFRAIIARIPVA